MTVITRFAPSPTGLLHVGNARMALINWLYAHQAKGQCILRLDDTDAQRSTAEFAEAIGLDLAWMGITFDTVERQSSRLAQYDGAFETLKDSGRVYPCYETPQELEFMRNRLRTQGKPPIYTPPSDEKQQTFIDEGRTPHWRFRLQDGDIEWVDLVRGPVHFETKNLSDPVIRREDGSWLYMLPSAVDDIDMNITHVVRGEDHVANTAVQVQMYLALGATVPAFAHLPLLTDISGQGLSKRLGSITLQSLRDDGIEPMALASYLARLGTSDDITTDKALDTLASGFDFTHFSRATPKFDPAQLERLNAQTLHDMAFADVEQRLSAMGLEHADEAFWHAVRPNVVRINDARIWHGVCFTDTHFEITDPAFAAAALDVLPDTPWDDTTWKTWTGLVKDKTGKKGKELFQPLRLILTGLDHGPELKALLPIIGRERVVARLSSTT